MNKKLGRIQLLILDVDGVLTDGSIIYNGAGDEIKVFQATDGLGIRLLMKAGVDVCIVTGRTSDALHHRCRNLGITHVFDAIRQKAAILDDITRRTKVPPERMAFMGDDLPDLPLMEKVGMAIAVKNAHEMVQSGSDFITKTEGGQGAVREVCELIIKARGCWESVISGIYQ